ncbi:hypothetical protein ACOSQ3_013390 [Xanthoceras sorbifolium]
MFVKILTWQWHINSDSRQQKIHDCCCQISNGFSQPCLVALVLCNNEQIEEQFFIYFCGKELLSNVLYGFSAKEDDYAFVNSVDFDMQPVNSVFVWNSIPTL